jgi:hypothetical protein
MQEGEGGEGRPCHRLASDSLIVIAIPPGFLLFEFVCVMGQRLNRQYLKHFECDRLLPSSQNVFIMHIEKVVLSSFTTLSDSATVLYRCLWIGHDKAIDALKTRSRDVRI